MKKKKILVVDDNPVMRTFMTKLLQKEGHEVSTAYDGYVALDIIISEKPEVLFIDLVMPKIGGDILCQMIRKMPYMDNSYLVVISAALAEMDFDYQKVGADACIAKGPFDKMAKFILTAIEESDAPKQDWKKKPIMGLAREDESAVHPRQMTKELLSRNRHLESMLNSVQEGILELFSNTIVYVNEHAESVFGIGKEDLLARDFVDLFKPVDQMRVTALLGPRAEKAAPIDCDDPVTVNGRQLAIRVFSGKGKVASSTIMVSDVTQQNIAHFQKYHSDMMNVRTTLTTGTAKAFQKLAKALGQTLAKLLEAAEGDKPNLKKVTLIDRHIQEMEDMIRQLTTISEASRKALGKPLEPLLKGKETILLADGETLIRLVDRMTLEGLGYKVLVARTARDVISKYKVRYGKKYSNIEMVIVAENIQGMKIGEVISGLKEVNPELKILVSVVSLPEDGNRLPVPKGASGLIQKPFDLRLVSSLLREVIELP